MERFTDPDDKPMNSLIAFFHSHDWEIALNGRERMILFTLRGRKLASLDFSTFILDRPPILMTVVRYPFYIPQERMEAAIAMVTHANYGLDVGKFELSRSSGELYYKTHGNLTGGDLPRDVIEVTIDTAQLNSELYFDGFTQIIFGGADVTKTLEEIEAAEAQRLAREEEFLGKLRNGEIDPYGFEELNEEELEAKELFQDAVQAAVNFFNVQGKRWDPIDVDEDPTDQIFEDSETEQIEIMDDLEDSKEESQ